MKAKRVRPGLTAGKQCGLFVSVAGCAFVAAAQSAHAQVVNPGTIENEMRRQQQRLEQREDQNIPRERGPAVIGPKPPPPGVIIKGGPTFLLRELQFDESKFLSKDELEAIVAPYRGRKITLGDLQTIAQLVNELYQAKGIVTGLATIPPQTVDTGIVKIKLTEGRLGKTTVSGNVQTRQEYIEGHVALPKPGEVVDVPALTNSVTWFNRSGDVQVRALLQPGSTFGLTDLQLAVTEPPRHTLQFFVDNQGVEATDRYQEGIYIREHGLLGIDDRFTFYGVRSRGNLSGNIAYNVPMNPWGGRVGVSYTQGLIKILNGPTASLDVTGRSHTLALNATQPFWVDQTWLMLANAGIARSASHTDFAGQPFTDFRTDKATGGYTITHSSPIHSVTVSPAVNYVESREVVNNIPRYFMTYTGTAQAYLKLPDQFSVSGLANWQYTEERLLPGDQLFTIGGPTTVRGYPTNAVSGDSGYFANVEVHYNFAALIKGLDMFGFYDRGEVYAPNPPRRFLASYGAGLTWTPVPAFTGEFTAAVTANKLVFDMRREQYYFRAVLRPLLLFSDAATAPSASPKE